MALSNKFLKKSGLGYLIPKKVGKRKRMPQGRTMETLLLKKKKMKALYGRLFRKNKKLKAKEAKNPKLNPTQKNKTYFCDKFPTFDSYAKNYKLREIKTAEKKVSKSTVISKRKKVWGM